MIKRLNKVNQKLYPILLDFIENSSDMDFYYTAKNTRYYVTSVEDLKKLFKNSEYIYISNNGDYDGIIMLWKGIGGTEKRYYIKINAKNVKVAEKLLTVLIWNCGKKDLFIKIRKNSKFLKLFKKKGFRFLHGRGIQLLLRRKSTIKKEEKT